MRLIIYKRNILIKNGGKMKKIGRNDPCHCGSGKKYKRCCLNIVPQNQSDDLTDIFLNKLKNMDEAAIQELTDKIKDLVSSIEPGDYLGMTQEQIDNWSTSDFATLQGITISTPNDLSQSPVMMYLDILIKAMLENQNKIELSNDYEPPISVIKACSDLYDGFEIKEEFYDKEKSDFQCGEITFFKALGYTQFLAVLSDIFLLEDKTIIFNPEYIKQYETHGINALFIPMLDAAVNKLEWGDFDGYKSHDYFQDMWVFMVWRFSKHQEPILLMRELMAAFPEVIDILDIDGDLDPKNANLPENLKIEMLLGLLIYSRFTSQFMLYFGFIKSNYDHEITNELITKDPSLRLKLKPTAIFHETFKFDW